MSPGFKDLEARQAHPYDFAPLPHTKHVAGAPRAGHGWEDPARFSGSLTATLTARSAITVASGQYALSEDAGFAPGFVVRAIARSGGQPVLPGSSLRGALRANFEIVTRSCLGHVRTAMDERYHRGDRRQSRVPQALIDDLVAQGAPPVGRARVELEIPEGLRPCRARTPEDTARLCPACLVFGVEAWQGLVAVDEARPVELPDHGGARFALPASQGPQLHRVGRAQARVGPRGPELRLTALYGRKVYYSRDGRPTKENPVVPTDYVPEGARFAFGLTFHNLGIEEIGALLAALGLDAEHIFPFRVGGNKPFGLGLLDISGIHVRRFDLRASALDFDAGPGAPLSLNECLLAYLGAPLAHLPGLEALHRIALPYEAT